MNITPGTAAPEFSLKDQAGEEFSLSAQRGAPVVLYFYPKDDTPGCTTQACSIRDSWSDLTAAGAVVAGISPDDVDSHAAFAVKHDLPHRLLADTERSVIAAYGAVKTKPDGSQGVLRSSVVIDADGAVVAVFADIAPEDQAGKALDALRGLG